MKNLKKEYISLVENYNSSIYSRQSTLVPKNIWSQPKKAEAYLEKYWLSKKEYDEHWKPIQDAMFTNQEKGLPDLKFTKSYEMLTLRGGVLFEEKDFLQLQSCMNQVGDKYFVVIENSFGDIDKPLIRVKFPVDITWKDLMSGSFISDVIIDCDINEYFVFGESGAWGKYAANDYIHALDIVGFKKEYSSLFREVFKVLSEEDTEISEWVPKGYLDR